MIFREIHHEVRWSMIMAADNRNPGRPRTGSGLELEDATIAQHWRDTAQIL